MSLRSHSTFWTTAFPSRCLELNRHSEEERFCRDDEPARRWPDASVTSSFREGATCRDDEVRCSDSGGVHRIPETGESAFRFYVAILRRSSSAPKNLALRILFPSFRVQRFLQDARFELRNRQPHCHSEEERLFRDDEESAFAFVHRGFSSRSSAIKTRPHSCVP